MALLQKRIEISLAHPANANEAHGNLLRGGIVAEQSRRDKKRREGRTGPEPERLPTTDFLIRFHSTPLLVQFLGKMAGMDPAGCFTGIVAARRKSVK
jgi:hypothetical protein